MTFQINYEKGFTNYNEKRGERKQKKNKEIDSVSSSKL
jgi:hypothetical protein